MDKEIKMHKDHPPTQIGIQISMIFSKCNNDQWIAFMEHQSISQPIRHSRSTIGEREDITIIMTHHA